MVEPGIVLDELNSALAPHGLMFGPRPATHDHCTLGGMIGNNSCGATAQAYGKTVDNVLRLEVLTHDGERFWAGPTSDEEYAAIVAAGGRRAEIYQALRELSAACAGQIRKRYPRIPRRVSGYNLDSLLPEHGFDVGRALVGSESTLVTILHAELRLVPAPAAQALLIDEAGAASASVITYVMPVVALFLGVALLGERLTVGAIAGLILIALGAWLATSRHTPGEVLASVRRRRARHRGPRRDADRDQAGRKARQHAGNA